MAPAALASSTLASGCDHDATAVFFVQPPLAVVLVLVWAYEDPMTVPLVVRLEGTNVEQGREILANSGLPIIPGGDLDDAAQKICEAVAG